MSRIAVIYRGYSVEYDAVQGHYQISSGGSAVSRADSLNEARREIDSWVDGAV